jgi:hypothetical protein
VEALSLMRALKFFQLSTADIFVIVFSLTDRESFEKVPSFFEQINKCRKRDAEFIVRLC